jgi:hypothetical protein
VADYVWDNFATSPAALGKAQPLCASVGAKAAAGGSGARAGGAVTKAAEPAQERGGFFRGTGARRFMA